jgi:hypothetical protein
LLQDMHSRANASPRVTDLDVSVAVSDNLPR